MEYNSAKNLIKKTFETSFDKDQFRTFMINLLNEVDSSQDAAFTYRGNTIPKAYNKYVRTFHRMGKFEDEEGKIVDVLVVRLEKESSLERARTMQRNLIGWYLNGSRGGVQKDAALVAFVTPNSQDWRFSFVKMDYELVEQESGGVTVEQTFTPARRFSFLVGTNEYSHTAQQRLVSILENDKHKPSFAELENAFSVEPVTQRFYEDYRELFLKLKGELDRLEENNEAIHQHFEKHHVDNVDFAKKLLGQIVFLYFLQKKGWFGVPKGGDWGSGPKHFLRELFEEKHTSYSNFFDDILEPLFYEALAKKRSLDDDYYSRFNCRIPFLNGGLFDPIQNYDWVNTNLLLPDALFSNEDKTGILDVFDRYNFTVKENEPLEKEVAVDPEMLGKVFENLLEINDRKSKGTYYTPREIVHYMCQESLVNYLETELDGRVPADDLDTFVRFGEQALQNDRQVEAQQQETERYEYKIPETVRNYAKAVDEKLASIRVCDPAVGSGAFLVGMMKEIVRKREVLSNYLSQNADRTVYNFKLNAIHNSLYGVDIDPGAVEIAKLRLWLSLVVEEENIHHIKALPNLVYKIMQGNSLLEEYEGVKLIDERFFEQTENNQHVIKQLEEQQKKAQNEYIKLHQSGNLSERKEKELSKKLKKIPKRIEQYQEQEQTDGTVDDLFSDGRARKIAAELQKLQDQFFDLSRRGEKRMMKEKIEDKSWDLIEHTLQEQDEEEKLEEIKALREKRQSPFFLWHLHFADIFQKNGGFDVVIGNPPYIQLQKIRKEADQYKKANYMTFRRTGDIYCLFYEQGFNLLKDKGVLTFITSSKWMRSSYGKLLRKFFITVDSQKVISLGPNIFYSATVDTNIYIGQKRQFQSNVKGYIANKREKIERLQNEDFVPMPYTDEDKWIVLDEDELKINEHIKEVGTPLAKWNLKINFGIKTGYNKAFIIGQAKRDELVEKGPKSAKIIKPILRGRYIERYKADWNRNYLINTHNGIKKLDIPRIHIEEYPAIKNYLENEADYERISNRYDQGDTPFNLRNCAYLKEFEKEKIIWKRIGSIMRFSYSSQEIYCLDSTCIATGEKIKYLTAILNSKAGLYQLVKTSPRTGTGDQIISVQALKPFLAPYPKNEVEQKFNNLVDIILFIKSQNSSIIESLSNKTISNLFEEIVDFMVYELYFEEHMRERDIDVLQFIDFPIFDDIDKVEAKKQTAKELYHKLNERDNPIRNRMMLAFARSPNIIKKIDDTVVQ